ncbi:MAG TPA: hypothetical protein VMS22_07890 [Candidatus Eisenbacteria bacterium]|nr:hypothetical protein [Candidatus Eisenbacteria bacterium]
MFPAILATRAVAAPLPFWRMRPWLPVGAALYMLQVAAAHLVWSELSPRGHGILVGLVQAALFVAIAVVFWRSRPYFRDPG